MIASCLDKECSGNRDVCVKNVVEIGEGNNGDLKITAKWSVADISTKLCTSIIGEEELDAQLNARTSYSA